MDGKKTLTEDNKKEGTEDQKIKVPAHELLARRWICCAIPTFAFLLKMALFHK
jgi:hypothetical protein